MTRLFAVAAVALGLYLLFSYSEEGGLPGSSRALRSGGDSSVTLAGITRPPPAAGTDRRRGKSVVFELRNARQGEYELAVTDAHVGAEAVHPRPERRGAWRARVRRTGTLNVHVSRDGLAVLQRTWVHGPNDLRCTLDLGNGSEFTVEVRTLAEVPVGDASVVLSDESSEGVAVLGSGRTREDGRCRIRLDRLHRTLRFEVRHEDFLTESGEVIDAPAETERRIIVHVRRGSPVSVRSAAPWMMHSPGYVRVMWTHDESGRHGVLSGWLDKTICAARPLALGHVPCGEIRYSVRYLGQWLLEGTRAFGPDGVGFDLAGIENARPRTATFRVCDALGESISGATVAVQFADDTGTVRYSDGSGTVLLDLPERFDGSMLKVTAAGYGSEVLRLMESDILSRTIALERSVTATLRVLDARGSLVRPLTLTLTRAGAGSKPTTLVADEDTGEYEASPGIYAYRVVHDGREVTGQVRVVRPTATLVLPERGSTGILRIVKHPGDRGREVWACVGRADTDEMDWRAAHLAAGSGELEWTHGPLHPTVWVPSRDGHGVRVAPHVTAEGLVARLPPCAELPAVARLHVRGLPKDLTYLHYSVGRSVRRQVRIDAPGTVTLDIPLVRRSEIRLRFGMRRADVEVLPGQVRDVDVGCGSSWRLDLPTARRLTVTSFGKGVVTTRIADNAEPRWQLPEASGPPYLLCADSDDGSAVGVFDEVPPERVVRPTWRRVRRTVHLDDGKGQALAGRYVLWAHVPQAGRSTSKRAVVASGWIVDGVCDLDIGLLNPNTKLGITIHQDGTSWLCSDVVAAGPHVACVLDPGE